MLNLTDFQQNVLSVMVVVFCVLLVLEVVNTINKDL